VYSNVDLKIQESIIMDAFGTIVTVLVLTALTVDFIRKKPEISDRIKAFYERIKYVIGSLLVRD
jgi:hypothetical protein